MGDSFKEIEAGLELATKWLPKIFSIFGFLTNRGVPPAQAAQMIDDHLEAGKPNIRELED